MSTSGNTNALKWTAESTLETLNRIEAEACKEETHFLTSALRTLRICRSTWSYWKKKFSANDEILELMEIIEGIFEDKLFVGALTRKIHSPTAIFGLKYNYHWTDHHETQAAPPLTPEMQQAILRASREPAIIKMADGRVISLP